MKIFYPVLLIIIMLNAGGCQSTPTPTSFDVESIQSTAVAMAFTDVAETQVVSPTSIPTDEPTLISIQSDNWLPDPNSTNFGVTWSIQGMFRDANSTSELTITMGRTGTSASSGRGWSMSQLFDDGSSRENDLIIFPHQGEEDVSVILSEYRFFTYRMKIMKNGWLVFMDVNEDGSMGAEVYRVPPIKLKIHE